MAGGSNRVAIRHQQQKQALFFDVVVVVVFLLLLKLLQQQQQRGLFLPGFLLEPVLHHHHHHLLLLQQSSSSSSSSKSKKRTAREAAYDSFMARVGYLALRSFAYITGHCYFDAAVASAGFLGRRNTDNDTPLRVWDKTYTTPDLRGAISRVYTAANYRGSSGSTEAFGTLNAGAAVSAAEIRSTPHMRQAAGVTDLNTCKYFEARAEMHRAIDCSKTAASLWQYVQMPDITATVVAFLRPIVVVTHDPIDTDTKTVQVYRFRPRPHARLEELTQSVDVDVSNGSDGLSGKCAQGIHSILCLSSQLPPLLVSFIAPFLFPDGFYNYTDSTSRVFVHYADLGCCHEVGVGTVPVRPIFIEFNGANGIAGHYWPCKKAQSQRTAHSIPASLSTGLAGGVALGEAPAKKKTKGQKTYKRHEIKSKWFEDFPWLRQGKVFFFCYACGKHPSHAPKDSLANGTMKTEKPDQSVMRIHDGKAGHKRCVELCGRTGAVVASQKAVSTARLGISLITTDELICKHITTVYTAAKLCLPLSVTPGLLEMRSLDGPITDAYQNHPFWDEVLPIIAGCLFQEQDRRVA